MDLRIISGQSIFKYLLSYLLIAKAKSVILLIFNITITNNVIR